MRTRPSFAELLLSSRRLRGRVRLGPKIEICLRGPFLTPITSHFRKTSRLGSSPGNGRVPDKCVGASNRREGRPVVPSGPVN